MNKEPIIQVIFNEPINGKTDFHFGSLSAIYEQFTPEQIGCKVETLWNHSITKEKPYKNAKCTIERTELVRKSTKRGIKS